MNENRPPRGADSVQKPDVQETLVLSLFSMIIFIIDRNVLIGVQMN